MNEQIKINNSLSTFAIAKFNLTIVANTSIFLPEYKGSTLRGGFGSVFKKVCCVQRRKDCDICLLKSKCVYSVIFESSPQENSEKMKNYDEIPRPFVIEPPIESKTHYSENEELTFGLVLFGKAIEYLPYMVYTFIELGKIGIGTGRGKFTVKQVTNANDIVIYDGNTQTFKNENSLIDIGSVSTEFSVPQKDVIKISFLTPTRIKHQGHYTSKPEFHILVRALLRRISALIYFYCDQKLEVNFKNLLLKSESVKFKQNNTRWFDWERYSSRQDTKMKLGGFIGDVTYEGNLTSFLPFLILGQYTHIGKNCTFGLGKYEIMR